MADADRVGEVLLRAQKAAAWERAKGELRSMIEFQGNLRLLGYNAEHAQQFSDATTRLDAEIEAFIEKIEYESLQE